MRFPGLTLRHRQQGDKGAPLSLSIRFIALTKSPRRCTGYRQVDHASRCPPARDVCDAVTVLRSTNYLRRGRSPRTCTANFLFRDLLYLADQHLQHALQLRSSATPRRCALSPAARVELRVSLPVLSSSSVGRSDDATATHVPDSSMRRLAQCLFRPELSWYRRPSTSAMRQ